MKRSHPFALRTALLTALAASTLSSLAWAAETYEYKKLTPRLTVTAPSSTGSSGGTSSGSSTGTGSDSGSSAGTPQAGVSTTALTFADTFLGASDAQSVLLLNNGTAPLSFTSAQVVGSSFSASTLCNESVPAGQDCSTTVTFRPDAQGLRTGTLTFNVGTGSTLQVSLQGTGLMLQGQWGAEEVPAYGDVYTGASLSRTFVFTNTGNTPLSLGYASLSSTAYFSFVANTCGTTDERINLAPGASCSTTVRFSTSSMGDFGATLRMNTNANAALSTLALTGRGVNSQGALVAVSNANFGVVDTGQSVERTFTYTASGNVAAAQVQASVQGADLAITANTCGTAAAPVTSLAAGSTCSVTVRYAPVSAGALVNAKLVVASTTDSDSLDLQGSAQAALASNCKKDSAGQVWCKAINNTDSGLAVCGYPAGYSGTYFAATTAAATAWGMTLNGTDCATNYTTNVLNSTEIRRSARSCWTDAQRWTRTGEPSGAYSRVFVRCANME